MMSVYKLLVKLDFIKEEDSPMTMFGSDFEGSHLPHTQTSLCLKNTVHQGFNEYKNKNKSDSWLYLWRCARLWIATETSQYWTGFNPTHVFHSSTSLRTGPLSWRMWFTYCRCLRNQLKCHFLKIELNNPFYTYFNNRLKCLPWFFNFGHRRLELFRSSTFLFLFCQHHVRTDHTLETVELGGHPETRRTSGDETVSTVPTSVSWNIWTSHLPSMILNLIWKQDFF